MIPFNFEARVGYARLLWQSRMRRWRFTFAALAAVHTCRRFTVMNDNKPPQKETILSRSLSEQVSESLSRDPANAKPSHVEYALKHHLSPEDKALCMQIAQRGVEMARQLNITIDLQLSAMDIATIHVVSCPLHLWRFLASDADDFSHDFTGIGRFIDRRAGVLTGGFKPRFAVKKS